MTATIDYAEQHVLAELVEDQGPIKPLSSGGYHYGDWRPICCDANACARRATHLSIKRFFLGKRVRSVVLNHCDVHANIFRLAYMLRRVTDVEKTADRRQT